LNIIPISIVALHLPTIATLRVLDLEALISATFGALDLTAIATLGVFLFTQNVAKDVTNATLRVLDLEAVTFATLGILLFAEKFPKPKAVNNAIRSATLGVLDLEALRNTTFGRNWPLG
jgi:CBS domain containing-hemolysin-like protein